jgi:hypothetical protein
MRQISGVLSAQWLDVERERGKYIFFFLKERQNTLNYVLFFYSDSPSLLAFLVMKINNRIISSLWMLYRC